MPQPILPPEIHQLIIDVVGNEYVSAKQPSKNGTREALQAFSLVCKYWHDLTLRYTFHNVTFPLYGGERDLKRHAELFRILEINPLIKGCIRCILIYLWGEVLPEGIETLCKAISPIETLCVVLETAEFEHDLLRPPLLVGLHPILTGQYLRDFSISAAEFPLCLLENLTNLRSLTLEGVRTVDTESGRDGAWRSESSTLEKLDMARSRRALGRLGLAVNLIAGLDVFFRYIKYLAMDLTFDALFPGSPCHVLLSRWLHLETLEFHWTAISMGKLAFIRVFFSGANANHHRLTETTLKWFETCQLIPWESFQGLRSLTYHITFGLVRFQALLEGEVDPPKIIFSGPSSLPQLQRLRVIQHYRTPYSGIEDILPILDVILHNFNKSIENPGSFPCLRDLYTEVNYRVDRSRRKRSHTLDNDRLSQIVVDRLPGVFGGGGRKETHGWTTSIVPNVLRVT